MAQDYSYTDYRWIGVTEIMPGDTNENLIVTDDSIKIGAGKDNISLKLNGKAIPYAAQVNASGKYNGFRQRSQRSDHKPGPHRSIGGGQFRSGGNDHRPQRPHP